MLRNIKLIHFKCFEQLELNCKQLNLLCGLNGMGKSSVIQALLMIRQSFETGELLAGRLVLNGERIDIGTGEDVLFEDAKRDVLGFSLESDKIEEPWEEEFDCPRTSDRLNIKNKLDEGALNNLLSDFFNDRLDEKIFDEESSSVREFLRHLGPILKDEDPPFDEESVRVIGLGFLYVSSKWRNVPPFGGHLVYVNAERVGPQKLYSVSSNVLTRRGDFGTRGEYAWDYLNRHQNDLLQADDPRCIEGEDRPLRAIVDQWMQDVCPGAHLQLEEVKAADAVIAGFTFDREDDVASRRYRATNVGFGLSYALPVILALLSNPGTLCLIENPEAHLHPRGQTKLAELAARASKAGVQVIAETHSDHFMDGVRIAVRDGLIEPENAAFHYFERKGNQTVVTSPQIDSDGRLSSWPIGFFDQHDENLARLLAPKE